MYSPLKCSLIKDAFNDIKCLIYCRFELNKTFDDYFLCSNCMMMSLLASQEVSGLDFDYRLLCLTHDTCIKSRENYNFNTKVVQ